MSRSLMTEKYESGRFAAGRSPAVDRARPSGGCDKDRRPRCDDARGQKRRNRQEQELPERARFAERASDLPQGYRRIVFGCKQTRRVARTATLRVR